jgi:hypothetical protein
MTASQVITRTHTSTYQWELNSSSVDDANDISTSWCLNNHEEGAVKTVLGVNLNNFLVVIGTLKKLDSCVKWTSVSLQEDGNTVNRGVEGVCSESSSLNGQGLGLEVIGLGSWEVTGDTVNFSKDMGSQREFKLSGVTDGDGVGASWSLEHGAERTLGTVLNVDAHLVRSVVWSLPQGNIGIKRTSVSSQHNVNTLHRRACV